MKRRVIKHGPSTLIISLPNAWVKKNNVQKGTELEVVDKGRDLLVKTDSTTQQYLTTDIDISGLDRTAIFYAIRGLYRLGYDTINVKFDNQTTPYYRKRKTVGVLTVIHEEVDRLIGYEVIQERKNSCVIKDLEAVSGRDFDQVMRRVFLLLLDAFEGFIKGAETGNKLLLETTEQRHDAITKFVSYCLRILNKQGYVIPMAAYYYFHIAALLDRIVDILKYAARDVLELKRKLHERVIALFKESMLQIRLYYELFYTYSRDKIKEMSVSRIKIYTTVRSLDSGIDQKERVIAANIAHIAEVIIDLIEARTALEYAPKPT